MAKRLAENTVIYRTFGEIHTIFVQKQKKYLYDCMKHLRKILMAVLCKYS